jgi:hypothetical protein
MADDMDKVVEKIQKLFALAQSSNENEASTALAMAHELLKKHNLTMDSLQSSKSALVIETYMTANHPWETTLLNTIAKVNYCGIYRQSKFLYFGSSGRAVYDYELVLVGKPHNIAAVKVMADYIFSAIDRKARNLYGKGRAVIASYKTGFAMMVTKRLQDMQRQEMAQSDCRALIVVADAEVKQHFAKEKMGTYRAHSKATDYSGYHSGMRDGANLSLNDQVGGRARAFTAIA